MKFNADHIVRFLQPQISGHVQITESDPYFADNDLGTGARVTMEWGWPEEGLQSAMVELTWHDWNHLSFESI
ncbi:MAG: hypothetical protein KAJ19_22155 [Gammaproteobacteria bacterium]|nr:hypothetical protein [Gammaproteobacteria bacterium]